MNHKKIPIFFSLAALIALSPITAFGYGLGDAESQNLQINDASYKIKTTISPEIIENQTQEFSLSIELIDASTDTLVKNVDYSMKILDEKDNVVFDANVGTNDEKLALVMISENTNDFSFSQEQVSELWETSISNPLEITGPIFLEGEFTKYKLLSCQLVINSSLMKVRLKLC